MKGKIPMKEISEKGSDGLLRTRIQENSDHTQTNKGEQVSSKGLISIYGVRSRPLEMIYTVKY
jgi:hypothetical protein